MGEDKGKPEGLWRWSATMTDRDGWMGNMLQLNRIPRMEGFIQGYELAIRQIRLGAQKE
jgi:hypothetical protein